MDKPEILPTTISLGIKKKYTAAETINIPKVIIEKSLIVFFDFMFLDSCIFISYSTKRVLKYPQIFSFPCISRKLFDRISTNKARMNEKRRSDT
ncbi:hypothetical protein BLAHAN_05157 [Blautia hansenii DSM 20583]|uniref:Uncharacterized protein n=1 Tax=Blautia hansenii DSM 20583 TaxID=537007 RepID=C9L6Z7_BLAHA|nr:hypothetical protein BLAHAN_05157 [Blautia hansenii DSM 20583]